METTSLQEATDLLNNFEQAIRENDLVRIDEIVERYKHLKVNLVHPKK